MRPKRRLVDIGGLHADLVVPRLKVKLGEEPSAVELVEQLVDDGNRERILDRERVERAVVDAETPRAVRLLDEDDRGREGGVAAANDPLLDHGGALAFQLVLVRRRVPVRVDNDRRSLRLKDDAVVAGALGRQATRLREDVGVVRKEVVEERCR